MPQTVRILLPIFPHTDIVFFKGYVSISEQQEIVVYITEYTIESHEELRLKFLNDENVIFGYCSEFAARDKLHVNHVKQNTLALEIDDTIRVKSFSFRGKQYSRLDDCIIMLYDHAKLKRSEVVNDNADHLSMLQLLVKYEFEPSQPTNEYSPGSPHEPALTCPRWLSSSMLAQHIINYINLIKWIYCTIKRERMVSLKVSNLILAMLIDLTLPFLSTKPYMGFDIMAPSIEDRRTISVKLMEHLENLITILQSLLKWLMGAPAGLKLNNAFNKMLGKYFSYHIQLWWLFLDISGEKLDVILQVYHSIGYFGASFQAALLSDLISITTFHSYCIYVYAARLFNLQVSGLIALLRLFVGRKYNPLRGGIDSCEYTNQQLFVGTVAFTILLLLLPTTTMYYIVFTLFRLLSLVVQYILAKLIYYLQTIPVFVLVHWLFGSSRVAGNVLVQELFNEEGAPLVLRVQLLSRSLSELIGMCRHPVKAPKHFNWSNVLSNVFRGKQLI